MILKSLHIIFLFLILPESVTLRWNKNNEHDLAGYTLYYGYESNRYVANVNVGMENRYTLENLQSDTDYYFAVTAFDTNGNESEFSNEIKVHTSSESEDEQEIDESKYECANFPNPFNPLKENTRIRFFLTDNEGVTIRIYNVLGKHVYTVLENQHKNRGDHSENYWTGRDKNGDLVRNGTYICEIKTSSFHRFTKIIVMH